MPVPAGGAHITLYIMAGADTIATLYNAIHRPAAVGTINPTRTTWVTLSKGTDSPHRQ
jgi:hypothetical protein